MGISFHIDGREIGPTHPPYIIAEISGNHNQSIQRAVTLIEKAKECGADAVKLQTYTADCLTIDSDRDEFTLKAGTWAGKNLYKLYQSAYTPWDWFPELFKKAKDIGITVFSSPFSISAVDLLEGINAPAYKIASNELTDWPLVERVAKTGKPIIMSTGAATRQEVKETVEFARSCGCQDIALLHCVSEYPAPLENANMLTIDSISNDFDVVPGFSDHTMGATASVVAVARGACIIEKHFTLDRQDGGVDSTFSAEPLELADLCTQANMAWKSLGKIEYGGETNLEKKGIFTRQFWTIKDINAGEVINQENIKSIRAPSSSRGIPTQNYIDVIGRKTLKFIKKHEPLTKDDII